MQNPTYLDPITGEDDLLTELRVIDSYSELSSMDQAELDEFLQDFQQADDMADLQVYFSMDVVEFDT